MLEEVDPELSLLAIDRTDGIHPRHDLIVTPLATQCVHHRPTPARLAASPWADQDANMHIAADERRDVVAGNLHPAHGGVTSSAETTVTSSRFGSRETGAASIHDSSNGSSLAK
jgi:hypothetical protein